VCVLETKIEIVSNGRDRLDVVITEKAISLSFECRWQHMSSSLIELGKRFEIC
jgi:hypothetical protein